jgi:hypothetical protein
MSHKLKRKYIYIENSKKMILLLDSKKEFQKKIEQLDLRRDVMR